MHIKHTEIVKVMDIDTTTLCSHREFIGEMCSKYNVIIHWQLNDWQTDRIYDLDHHTQGQGQKWSDMYPEWVLQEEKKPNCNTKIAKYMNNMVKLCNDYDQCN
jgi:hypothetical protein